MTDSIYDDKFVQDLFNEMQDTYERVSNVTSFGFNLRWRKQLVNQIGLESNMTVADLMGGSGETWRYIIPHLSDESLLYNVDFAQSMCDYAHIRHARMKNTNIKILQENALSSSIPDNSVDAVICVYGVKTLDPYHYESFVREIKRVLKPQGRFGLVEISVPKSALLRELYMFYLSQIVPIIGALLLGNHENFRMLSKYMQAFQNCETLAQVFEAHNFDVSYHNFFFGCCTALTGSYYVD
ncbi:MAG: class I SAM-dependent methyltransferase [Chloroflexota bacterium]